jgi:transcriptional regulator with XRE-family HTH domain
MIVQVVSKYAQFSGERNFGLANARCVRYTIGTKVSSAANAVLGGGGAIHVGKGTRICVVPDNGGYRMESGGYAYKTFGDFLSEKRREKEIPSSRVIEFASISLGYYSDIEKNRRNPPSDRELLGKIAEALHFSDADLAVFYDLAGKARSEAPPDLPDYINENEVVRVALRLAKNTGSDDDWLSFIEQLKSRQDGG